MNFTSSVGRELNRDFLDHLESVVRVQLRGRIRGLRITLGADGLILQGHVGTYHAKQLAQHALMAATTVPIASNEIDVHQITDELRNPIQAAVGVN